MTFRIIPFLLFLLVVSSYGGPLVAPSKEVVLSTEPVPIYSNLTCQENGIFRVNESCREFYHCCDWDGSHMQIYLFTCQQGTIFDNFLGICNSPDMVSTKSVCVTETIQDNVSYTVRNSNLMPVLERTKRSLTNEENCTQQVVEIAAESAKDTCILIYHVNKYVNVVNSMIPVRLPDYVTQEEYKNFVEQYNIYLENAQNHTDIWYKGDDIQSGIKLIYELARLFGPEFQRKYQIVQDKLKELQEDTVDPETVLALENDIINLKQENTDNVAMINDVKEEFLKSFFLKQIVRNLERIEKKEKLLSNLNLPVMSKLKEMVAFMEFVRDDASRIETKANLTSLKLKDFKQQVLKDSKAFNMSMKGAKDFISFLEQDKNNAMAVIEKFKAKKQKLELERQSERDEMNAIRDKMNEELEEMKRFLARNSLATVSAFEKHSSGTAWMALPVIGWVYGGIKMSEASADIQRLIQHKANKLSVHDIEIKVFENRLSKREQDINDIIHNIEREEQRIQKERDDIKRLTFVNFFLETVMNDSEMIIPFITKAVKSLAKMEVIFDNIVFRLESLIYRANEVKGEAESQNLEYIIFEDLNDMMINWNNSYTDIISLAQCTQVDFINLLTQPPELITSTTEISFNSTGTTEPNTTSTILSVSSTEGVEPQTSLITPME